MMPKPARLPSYFLSHGGGPWPFMDGPFRGAFGLLEASLQRIPRELGGIRPRAVLMVSGHWEAESFRVMSAAQPGMVYDYHGFPPHTYTIRYPAPGDPALARRIAALIEAAGLPTRLDDSRGFDHGAFSTLYPMYPQAEVPLVQVSMQSGYDPAAHLALGRALAPLRDEGVLLIGSGFSFHNLRLFGPQGLEPSRAFDDWLQHTLLRLAPEQRSAALLRWDQAPAARIAHPAEDHLIPLLVAVGAAEQESAQCIYHEDRFRGGVSASSFRFGAALA